MTSLLLPPLGHAGEPVAPHDLVGAWPFEPLVIIGLVGLAVLYVRGVRRLWDGEAGRRALPAWRAWCFAGAVLTLAVALQSPLEALAGSLFSAHMFQHLLLTLVAAPLLVLARPLLVTGMALAGRIRRAVLRAAPSRHTDGWESWWWLVAAVTVHAVTLWVWHLPGIYEAGVGSDLLHAVEHVTLLAGALPLWWIVADVRGRHANAAGVLAVFAALLQASGLAGLVTFSGEAWFDVHAAGAALWQLDPLQDQQLAGGLMWFPGGLAYMIAGATLFLRWLRADERAIDLRLEMLHGRTRDG